MNDPTLFYAATLLKEPVSEEKKNVNLKPRQIHYTKVLLNQKW